MLLRVEQRDFKILWEVRVTEKIREDCFFSSLQRNKQYLHSVITSLSELTNTLGE